MSWAVAIALAAIAFVAIAFGLRAPRQGWAMLGVALALGLAGYASQANPGLPGAPGTVREKGDVDGSALIDARRRVMGRTDEPVPPYLLTADAFARRGQYGDAAGLLRSAVREHPRDAEAWLALGNALVEHGEGSLSPAALYAYRQADAVDPGSAGPVFFLGLALIRQGEVVEAHRMWSAQLGAMPADTPGRVELATRFGMLDEAMRKFAAEAPGGKSPR
ncbi:MAG TPA: tetratricopeptide repeat protein [Croceibacterium sp.]|nr:tetratricopeptide repeat protein [Croceibacterium sp.]